MLQKLVSPCVCTADVLERVSSLERRIAVGDFGDCFFSLALLRSGPQDGTSFLFVLHTIAFRRGAPAIQSARHVNSYRAPFSPFHKLHDSECSFTTGAKSPNTSI